MLAGGYRLQEPIRRPFRGAFRRRRIRPAFFFVCAPRTEKARAYGAARRAIAARATRIACPPHGGHVDSGATNTRNLSSFLWQEGVVQKMRGEKKSHKKASFW